MASEKFIAEHPDLVRAYVSAISEAADWANAHPAEVIQLGLEKGRLDLDAPADENVRNLARAKGVKPEAITAMILDRPRHADIFAAVRKVGAAAAMIVRPVAVEPVNDTRSILGSSTSC